MSRSSIIVGIPRGGQFEADGPWLEPWRFYFTNVKYNMSASPAQAGGKNPLACSDKMRARFPATSGHFAMNVEIFVA
jgi:hypothetical protein